MDNCPIHDSKLVTHWLNNHPEITRIEWPAISPDLNSLENLWSKMVSHWGASNAKNKTSSIEHAKSAWELCRPTRSENYCENLVGSMSRRLGQVIDKAGGHVKY